MSGSMDSTDVKIRSQTEKWHIKQSCLNSFDQVPFGPFITFYSVGVKAQC